MFVSSKTLSKCLDGFNFDGLAKWLNKNNLAISSFLNEDLDITGLDLYKEIRDIIEPLNENFDNLDVDMLSKEIEGLNVYFSDDGILTCEVSIFVKTNQDFIKEYLDCTEKLKIEFKQNRKEPNDRWIEIEFVLFGQFPGYL